MVTPEALPSEASPSAYLPSELVDGGGSLRVVLLTPAGGTRAATPWFDLGMGTKALAFGSGLASVRIRLAPYWPSCRVPMVAVPTHHPILLIPHTSFRSVGTSFSTLSRPVCLPPFDHAYVRVGMVLLCNNNTEPVKKGSVRLLVG